MMIIGVRCSVDLLDIEGSIMPYKDVPVEIALPYRRNDFLAQKEHMRELEEYLIAQRLKVMSIHASQGRLTDDEFMAWALPAVQLAQAVGARVAIYHPENGRKTDRMGLQAVALQHVRRLQREAGDVRVALETFGGPKVILSPEEIRDRNLPMVLDTSHLFASRSFEIVESYASGIAVVHLSEPPTLPGDTPHMPVGPICMKVIRRLRDLAWTGIVTLEYMPQFHHHELLSDRQILENEFAGSPTE